MLKENIKKLLFPSLRCSFCTKRITNPSSAKSEEYVLNRIFRLPDICATCKKELEVPTSPFCLYCHKPLEEKHFNINNSICEDCKNTNNRNLIYNRSSLLYNGYLKKYIAVYKYRGKQSLANEFSYFLKIAYDCFYKNTEINFLTYVPMHSNRLLERGFNQSEILANRLCELTGIPVIDCLERVKDTRKQSKHGKKIRFQQIEGSFLIKKDVITKISSRNILIIDDIYTTGATIDECAKELKKAGVNDIYSLTLSRAYDIYS